MNGPQELQLDTTKLSDGVHDLRLVVRDAAGNEAERELAVQIDNTAPAAPALATDEAWSREAEATWSWNVSAETGGAPVIGGDVEVCGPLGCVTESLGADATSITRAVGQGSTTARVRLEDAAGNVGAWSQPVAALRDRTSPEVSVTPPGETVEAGRAVEAVVQPSDGVSGIALVEREVRINGGAWRATAGPEAFAAGAVVEWRARATDRAGNTSAWQDTDEVRVVAAPVATPVPTAQATATATPHPQPAARTKVTMRNLKARYRRGSIRVTGELKPAPTNARVTALRGRARVKRGRFVISIRTKKPPRRLAVRYAGSTTHLPVVRKVAVRR